MTDLMLIGAGSRGNTVYGKLALRPRSGARFVAVAEPDQGRREVFAKEHGIAPALAFPSWEKMLVARRQGIFGAAGIVIASPDAAHYSQAKAALSDGLHVLLEKPMATRPEECEELGRLAGGSDLVFMVCHVLRYTAFFSTLRGLVRAGAIGRLESIQHSENIGYWHFAHSFTRGNWRRKDESSPLILAKSCHDMDILLWLAGADCARVASFGSLGWLREENAPAGSGRRCSVDCTVEEDCPWSARAIYHARPSGWPSDVVTQEPGRAALDATLRTGPYGRCVYRSDNDVVDHQVAILEFEGGVTATFNLTAFTKEISRTIKLMGSAGEIRGDFGKNEIELLPFKGRRKVLRPKAGRGGHGGGDPALFADFVHAVDSGDARAVRSGAAESAQGHAMAFAAEEARTSGRVVGLRGWRGGLN